MSLSGPRHGSCASARESVSDDFGFAELIKRALARLDGQESHIVRSNMVGKKKFAAV
jgi:hypothetical protein